jgi:hypothetical protein
LRVKANAICLGIVLPRLALCVKANAICLGVVLPWLALCVKANAIGLGMVTLVFQPPAYDYSLVSP